MPRLHQRRHSKVLNRLFLAGTIAGCLACSSLGLAQEAEAPAAPPSIPLEHVEIEAEAETETEIQDTTEPARHIPVQPARSRGGRNVSASGLRTRNKSASRSSSTFSKSKVIPSARIVQADDEEPVLRRSQQPAAWAETEVIEEATAARQAGRSPVVLVDGESLVPRDGLAGDSGETPAGEMIEPDLIVVEPLEAEGTPVPRTEGLLVDEEVDSERASLAAPGEPATDDRSIDVNETPVDEEIEEVVEPAPLRQLTTQPKQMPRRTPIDRTSALDQPIEDSEPRAVGKFSEQDKVHQVSTGESYWTIAKKYYRLGRYSAALAEYNKSRIPKPDRINPGMKVIVPPVETLESRFPQLISGLETAASNPAARAPLKSGFFIDADGQPMYRVGEGDTLSDIAQSHLGRSSRWIQIVALNKDQLPDPDAMKLGMVLRLPEDASEATSAD